MPITGPDMQDGVISDGFGEKKCMWLVWPQIQVSLTKPDKLTFSEAAKFVSVLREQGPAVAYSLFGNANRLI